MKKILLIFLIAFNKTSISQQIANKIPEYDFIKSEMEYWNMVFKWNNLKATKPITLASLCEFIPKEEALAAICPLQVDCQRTLQLPLDSFVLHSQINLPDTITSMRWIQLTGTATSIIAPTSGTTSVKKLSAGTNVYNFTFMTKKGAAYTLNDTVTLLKDTTVIAPLPPTVTVTGTANTTFSNDTLFASAVDPNNQGITKYGWGKLAGPGTPVINGAATPQAIITGLQTGVYTFKVTVWNKAGLTGAATYIVTVSQQRTIVKVVIYYSDGTIITQF